MEYNFQFDSVDAALPSLADIILNEGTEMASRGGERVQELLHVGITLARPYRREVLVKGRRASLAAQIAETMWVLSGRNDVAWLERYLPRAADFSDDGKVWRGGYGPRIRSWGSEGFDQLKFVVEHLRSAAVSRRAVINIYDPSVDSAPGRDIPCNDWLHFVNRNGRLELHVATRSNDLIWGWSGINTFEWSALLEIVAGMVGVFPGRIHYSISSLHIYDRHWGRAEKFRSMDTSGVSESPRFSANVVGGDIETLDRVISRWFVLEENIRNLRYDDDKLFEEIADFPEAMMRSWLWVLAWHWRGGDVWMRPLSGTRLAIGAALSPKHDRPSVRPTSLSGDVRGSHTDSFVKFVGDLHEEKHAAYGDSWKRRGELISILANIARKVDRLGTNGAGDSNADTAIDLLVYLILYKQWLREEAGKPSIHEDEDTYVRLTLARLSSADYGAVNVAAAEEDLRSWFDEVDYHAQNHSSALEDRENSVAEAIGIAFPLARHLWFREQAATRRWAGYGDGNPDGSDE